MYFNNAIIGNSKILGCLNEKGELIGDPTETALIDFGDKNNCSLERYKIMMPRLSEIPFDSERKLMTTIHEKDSNTLMVATKGGFDELLSRCSHIMDSDGKTRLITDADKKLLAEKNEEMAKKALRVLCMAYSFIEVKSIPNEEELANVCCRKAQFIYETRERLIGELKESEQEDLFYKISENGGVFSDAPYNTQPSTILFPKRNSCKNILTYF